MAKIRTCFWHFATFLQLRDRSSCIELSQELGLTRIKSKADHYGTFGKCQGRRFFETRFFLFPKIGAICLIFWEIRKVPRALRLVNLALH